jgi:YniB-like protein
MNYASARREATTKRIVGTGIFVVAILFVLASLLLFIYGGSDSGGTALSGLSGLLRRLVQRIFEHTQYLLPIWNAAPIPNLRDLSSAGTLGFLACYIAVFIGASLVRSGNQLAQRLRAIDRQIEDEEIRESIKGGRRRSRSEIEEHVNVPKQSIWKEFHTLYLAPFLVGIVLWLVGKVFG